MQKEKLLVGTVLFILGLAGVLSILTMEIPLPEEAEKVLNDMFSPQQIKILILINPTILLLVFVVIGTLLYDKVGLRVPVIQAFIRRENVKPALADTLTYGVLGGILAGVLLTFVSYLFHPSLPEAFVSLGEKLKPSLPARFLYGGFTEEILMRFGLMTLIVWALSKLFKETNATVYWIAILVAALLFAVGHFPVVYQVVEEPSALLLSYVLLGNSLGGMIFGWLYWKKGLESAFVAHIFAHVVMVLA